MINKKLLSFDRGALRFVGANVAFQWLGMLCNVIFVRAIARLVGAAEKTGADLVSSPPGCCGRTFCCVWARCRSGLCSPCWHPA